MGYGGSPMSEIIRTVHLRSDRNRLGTLLRRDAISGRPVTSPRGFPKRQTASLRYTLCHWGDTEEKRGKVLAHLAAKNYQPADVSSWWYEWHWRSSLAQRQRSRRFRSHVEQLERDFIAACIAQLRYDHTTLAQWLGREARCDRIGSHAVPFFAEVADRLFEQFCRVEGVQFIPLEGGRRRSRLRTSGARSGRQVPRLPAESSLT